jgi:peptidoglycan/LPS O-acetylase OafA/YrhL
MFFVVSGFLITALLLEENEARNSISLRAFYMRRALRLLPAVFAALLFTVLVALLAGSFTAVGLTPIRLASTLLYFNNWLQTTTNDSPWFLTHFWSLSIEEQFYLIWPLALLALVRRHRRVALWSVVSAIALSCLLKAGLHWSGAPWQRIYHGSDTRADALLVGCLLSLLIYWRALPAFVLRHHVMIGRCAWMMFGALLIVADFRGSIAYSGGFTFAALVCAFIVLHTLIAPAAVLNSGLLLWIGKRSYGLYVWHWPVYLLVASSVPQAFGIPACLIGTFGFAALSYRYIEKPFLDLKHRRSRAGQVERSISPVSYQPASYLRGHEEPDLSIPN